MKLLRLSLRNFKGTRVLDIDCGGSDVAIYGDNATGKTTTADALYWLLFDKDSSGRKTFEIKTLGADGEALHNLDHEVEAEFELEGSRLSLRKVYKEVYTKQRGRATTEFTGHTTDFWVNGVPVGKREYEARVADVCGEDRFRLLTDPFEFCGRMKWQDRRKLLLEVCGDVSDADVIEAHPELNALPAILGAHTLDDYKRIALEKRRRINTELPAIATRIDEVSRSIESLPVESAGDPEVLRQRLNELREKRALVVAGGGVAAKQAELAGVNAELQAIESRIRSRATEAQDKAAAEKRRLVNLAAEHRTQAEAVRGRCRRDQQEKERLERKLNDLRTRYRVVNAQEFSGDTQCPVCEQPLPAEKVEAARARFNEDKSRQLKDILDDGNALKATAASLTEAIEKAEAEARVFEVKSQECTAAANQVQVPQAGSPAPINPMTDAEYAAASERRLQIEIAIENLREGVAGECAAIDAQIQAVQQDLDAAESARARTQQRLEGGKRIEALKAQEKELSAEFEALEGELFLIEEFIRAKVAMLSQRINDRFEVVSFRLFRDQINGGLEECCDVTVGGVPYDSLNHGSRVNAGLDVIRTLQSHFAFHPLTVVDGCESVTRLLPMPCQLVRLIVSASDPSLRVELSSREPALL